MTKPVSVKGVARRQLAADKRTRDAVARGQRDAARALVSPSSKRTVDSFVNFSFKMGVGADNPLSSAGYGFNPISRVRTTLEWIHRGSWLGGVAVDVIAEDMTRMGVEFQSDIDPEQEEKIEEAAVVLQVWNKIADVVRWSRLYGGAIGVMLIDGQDMMTPLRLDTIDKGQFKGLAVYDRWMLDAGLNDLITEMGPDMGKPKFYTIHGDSPGLRGKKIHYSRVLRMEGIKLPYWQAVMEGLWGISVIERLYDRLIAFDSATTGAAQLVYKAYIRTYKIKDLRDVIASGGAAMDGLVRYVDMMRRFQSIEGMTLLDSEDEMEASGHQAFSGLSDALIQFGQQLSGALQIPLVRLFGQSPAGLNATGESDIRTYYDGIKQKQESELRVPVTKIYRAIAQSEGIKLPDGFRINFRSLWQLSDKEKAEIANTTVDAVTKAEESGLITQQAAMKELQQSSHITGIFSNITDDEIEAAATDLPPAGAEAAELALAGGPDGEDPPKDGKDKDKDKK